MKMKDNLVEKQREKIFHKGERLLKNLDELESFLNWEDRIHLEKARNIIAEIMENKYH